MKNFTENFVSAELSPQEFVPTLEQSKKEMIAWAEKELGKNPEEAKAYVEKTFTVEEDTGRLVVDGNLALAGMPIRSFPSGVYVKENADFSGTEIATLPEIETGMCLFANKTPNLLISGDENVLVGKHLYIDPAQKDAAEELKKAGKIAGLVVI